MHKSALLGIAVSVLVAALGLWADRKAQNLTLKMSCPACGQPASLPNRFCAHCNTDLSDTAYSSEVRLALRQLVERRAGYAEWSTGLIVNAAVLLIVSVTASLIF